MCFRNPTKHDRATPQNAGAENTHYHQEIIAVPSWRMGTADTVQVGKSGLVISVRKQHFRQNPCASRPIPGGIMGCNPILDEGCGCR